MLEELDLLCQSGSGGRDSILLLGEFSQNLYAPGKAICAIAM
ncbi:hypothetical protein PMIT1320_01975 [Prochlorococcus marinus str. MIT 1320]|nr:hypothetical protein PMIT1320_01975 [Prochlorococcus marinus str. MIT 1320]